jgi:hypothetical protein
VILLRQFQDRSPSVSESRSCLSSSWFAFVSVRFRFLAEASPLRFRAGARHLRILSCASASDSWQCLYSSRFAFRTLCFFQGRNP